MIMVCIRTCVSQGGLDQLEPKLNFQMPAEGLEMPVLEELDFKNQFHYHILQSNTISLKSISSLGCSRVHPTFLHNDVTTQDFTGGLVDVLISMLFIPSILCWLLLNPFKILIRIASYGWALNFIFDYSSWLQTIH